MHRLRQRLVREGAIALVWRELRGDRLVREGAIAMVWRQLKGDRLVREGAIAMVWRQLKGDRLVREGGDRAGLEGVEGQYVLCTGFANGW